MEKPRIGVSSCLLGHRVRYDGGHKLDAYITNTLGTYLEWLPVCPEVESGLPVPREPMRLRGDPVSPRLVTVRTGVDHTARMLKWIEKRLWELDREPLCGFIFKTRSPTSGVRGVRIYQDSGSPGGTGAGIFGGAFIKRFPLLPVTDEGRLHHPELRENFIERVFVYKRWLEFLRDATPAKLAGFHAQHKMLIMSHSPAHLRTLGKLVSGLRNRGEENFFIQYVNVLMEGLQLIATRKKNSNVLMHIAGYFKRDLAPVEKKELLGIIDRYRKGYLPLIVPVVLINHYVDKFDKSYLQDQIYLHPHPVELMLRNHA